jgi:hypothetical protein
MLENKIISSPNATLNLAAMMFSLFAFTAEITTFKNTLFVGYEAAFISK